MYQYLILGSYSFLVSGILFVLSNDNSLDKEVIEDALRFL